MIYEWGDKDKRGVIVKANKPNIGFWPFVWECSVRDWSDCHSATHCNAWMRVLTLLVCISVFLENSHCPTNRIYCTGYIWRNREAQIFFNDYIFHALLNLGQKAYFLCFKIELDLLMQHVRTFWHLRYDAVKKTDKIMSISKVPVHSLKYN